MKKQEQYEKLIKHAYLTGWRRGLETSNHKSIEDNPYLMLADLLKRYNIPDLDTSGFNDIKNNTNED